MLEKMSKKLENFCRNLLKKYSQYIGLCWEISTNATKTNKNQKNYGDLEKPLQKKKRNAVKAT